MIPMMIHASWSVSILVFLANAIVASLLVCAVALIAERLARCGPLPLRHALLLCGLIVAMVSPLVVGLLQSTRWSLLALPLVTPGATVELIDDRPATNAEPDGEHVAASGASSAPVRAAAARESESEGVQQAGQAAGEPLAGTLAGGRPVVSGLGWSVSDALDWTGRGLLCAWLLGSGYQLLRLLGGTWQVHKLLATVQPIDDPRTHDLASSAARSLGLVRCPPIVQSAAVDAPLSVGVTRPCVVLPAVTGCEWSDDQWRSLLLHELAHIRRHDLLWGLLQRLALVVCWWNPLSARVSERVSLLREQICDDVAATHAARPDGYAALLVELASRAVSWQVAAGALAAAAGSPSELAQRVHRLLEADRRVVTTLNGWMMAGGGAFAALLLLGLAATSVHVATTRADEEKAKDTAAATKDEEANQGAAEASPAPDDDTLTQVVRIVNPAGEPVAGATVSPWAIRSVRGAHGGWGKTAPPVLKTDADGNVTIRYPRFADKDEQIGVKDLTCRVEHPDYAMTVYNDVNVTEGARVDVATITIRPGVRVEITAVVGDRKLPMDTVRAFWSSPTWAGQEQKVNAAGRLELPRLPAGSEFIRLASFPVEGPSLFSDVEELTLIDGETLDLRIEMKPAIVVEGKLDASVPRPVNHGHLVAQVIDRPDQGHSLEWRVVAPIHADGTFTLPAMPRGNVQIIALCDGYMATSGEPPAFANEIERKFNASFSRPQTFALAEEKNEITLAMTPTAECLIHVEGPDGKPVAGAHCAFWPNVGWWQGGSQIYGYPVFSTADGLPGAPQRLVESVMQAFAATTDEAGNALVKNLPASERFFVVQHDTLEPPLGEFKNRWVPVSLTAGQQAQATVTLQAKGTDFIGSP